MEMKMWTSIKLGTQPGHWTKTKTTKKQRQITTQHRKIDEQHEVHQKPGMNQCDMSILYNILIMLKLLLYYVTESITPPLKKLGEIKINYLQTLF